MTEQTFNPDHALIRYRELEALLNLELITRDDWQRARAAGDMRWLQLSKHFQAQEALCQEIEAHGYEINAYEDDDENPIYVIEKIGEDPDWLKQK